MNKITTGLNYDKWTYPVSLVAVVVSLIIQAADRSWTRKQRDWTMTVPLVAVVVSLIIQAADRSWTR
jgi:hypothetical protein